MLLAPAESMTPPLGVEHSQPAGPRAPLVMVARVVRPLIAALNWLANHVLRLFGVEPKDEASSAFTAQEVQSIVERSQAEGLLEDEQGLLAGAIEFSDRTARQVMVPRDALVAVDPATTPAQVESLVARTGFSRFPVQDDGELQRSTVHVVRVSRSDINKGAARLRRAEGVQHVHLLERERERAPKATPEPHLRA